MRFFLILLFAVLTGCGSALPTIKPYKMDIQQGNVVTSKMLLQLRPGMTKSQVKFIMGTPLIVDSFHKDRWDYFYQLRQAGKIVEQRRVILDFEKDLLTKVRGDVVPQGTAGAATGDESSVAKTITVAPKPKQEKSWMDRLKFWKKDEPAKEADKPTPVREKNDASEANKQAPSGDATGSSAGKATEAAPSAESDTESGTEPNAESGTDTPSVLAVPIGGVLAPEASATEAPAETAPAESVPAKETPVTATPAAETPVVAAPAVAAPVEESPTLEAPPPEMVKPAETAKPAEASAPTPEPVEAPVPTHKPAPAGNGDDRLIFRMDKNLDLRNLQAPAEEAPAPKVENNAAPTAAKPKQVEQPVPEEEAPGYFERILEKIGF